jgi:hypothetical protein
MAKSATASSRKIRIWLDRDCHKRLASFETSAESRSIGEGMQIDDSDEQL